MINTKSVTTETQIKNYTGKVPALAYWQLLDDLYDWAERNNLPLPIGIPANEVDQSHLVKA